MFPATGTPDDAPRQSREVPIPKSILGAAGALMLLTIAVAGIARHTGANHMVLPPTQAVASRDLTFTDRGDGAVVIADAAGGRQVAVVPPETGGFLRGIMRGLVREHRLNDLGPGTSFRLTRWADGRLSIEDPATRERFELAAFGATNEAAFARLLVDEPAADAAPGAGDAR